MQAGTTTEKNLADFSRANGLGIKPVVFDTFEAAFKALFSGRFLHHRCFGAGQCPQEAPNPDDYLILPELISKEPLGPFGAPR